MFISEHACVHQLVILVFCIALHLGTPGEQISNAILAPLMAAFASFTARDAVKRTPVATLNALCDIRCFGSRFQARACVAMHPQNLDF